MFVCVHVCVCMYVSFGVYSCVELYVLDCTLSGVAWLYCFAILKFLL